MEGILTYLRDELPNEIDGGTIVGLSTKIPLRQRQLKKLTAEWRGSGKRVYEEGSQLTRLTQ